VFENDMVGLTYEEEKIFGGLVNWRRSVAEAPTVSDVPVENSSFILAEQRTHRRDPLDGYKKYNGGWNISNNHYWAVSSLIYFCFNIYYYLQNVSAAINMISLF
jgi:hypothetical protein